MARDKKKATITTGSEKDPYVDNLVRKGNWAQIKKLAEGGNKAAIKVRDHRSGAASKPNDDKKVKKNAN